MTEVTENSNLNKASNLAQDSESTRSRLWLEFHFTLKVYFWVESNCNILKVTLYISLMISEQKY